MSPTLPHSASTVLVAAVVAFLSTRAAAQPAVPPTKLASYKARTVADALNALARDTAIRAEDRRTTKDTPPLALAVSKATFWQALDETAREASCAVSLYQRDGVPALVDGRPPTSHISYHGAYRIALRQIALTQNHETGNHDCHVQLEVAWEPELEPLYLSIDSYQATLGTTKHTGQSVSREPVHGRRAFAIDLRLPAPARNVQTIADLKGVLRFIVPERMVTARFDKLLNANPVTARFDEVAVTLRKFEVEEPKRWKVEMELTQPADGPSFESFQSWLSNNKLYLEQKSGQRLTPAAGDEAILEMTNSRAVVVYYLRETKNGPRLGVPANWQLVCRTPGRLREVHVPFQLRALPLP